jgi:hypothetical protein
VNAGALVNSITEVEVDTAVAIKSGQQDQQR